MLDDSAIPRQNEFLVQLWRDQCGNVVLGGQDWSGRPRTHSGHVAAMERGNDFQHGLADGDPQFGQLAENREDRLVLFEQIDAHLFGVRMAASASSGPRICGTAMGNRPAEKSTRTRVNSSSLRNQGLSLSSRIDGRSDGLPSEGTAQGEPGLTILVQLATASIHGMPNAGVKRWISSPVSVSVRWLHLSI